MRVKEDRNGPRFVPWEPISRRVDALANAKAKRVTRAARDYANEHSATRPGAAIPSAAKIAHGAMSEALAPSIASYHGPKAPSG